MKTMKSWSSAREPANWISVLVRVMVCCVMTTVAVADQKDSKDSGSPPSEKYVLGPDDEIAVRALEVEELDSKDAKPFVVDTAGDINMPLLGKVKVAGLTVDQLQVEIIQELKVYVLDPQVAVTVVEYRSQPVSVLGSVNTPGVFPLNGSNTLDQVLSKAGGLRQDAGNTIYITRKSEMGTIPLATDQGEPSGQFNTARVEVKDLLEATNPSYNIIIRPTDVISVPKADLVYVLGSVHRPGGFVLNERRDITVLQAVSMAEGLEKTSAPKRAKVIRKKADGSRIEIAVNLTNVLKGKSQDIPLFGNDVLFVPNSTTKTIAYRGIEAAIQTGTGIAVFR
jgi:polysaccharide export outer membrane protein